jgi:hypothetical protein
MSLATREVAREDAGVFAAVNNSVQRADGFTGPLIIFWIKNRFGSWLPVFWWAAIGKVLQLFVYRQCVSVRSARVLLHEQREQRGRKQRS